MLAVDWAKIRETIPYASGIWLVSVRTSTHIFSSLLPMLSATQAQSPEATRVLPLSSEALGPECDPCAIHS